MKLTIEKGVLGIDLRELVDEMTEEQRVDMCRYLVADQRLFANVLEIVADGHYNSDDQEGHWWFGREAVAELRLKLLPLLGDAMRGVIGELLRQRKQAQEDERRHREWAYRLFHAWPRDEWRSRPEGPADFVSVPPTTEAEIDALVPNEAS